MRNNDSRCDGSDEGLDVNSAADDLNRTPTNVLRYIPTPSPDCSCSSCVTKTRTHTKFELYMIKEADREYRGLIA